MTDNGIKALFLFYIAQEGFGPGSEATPENALQKLCGMTEEESNLAIQECIDEGYVGIEPIVTN